ncbi:hypothetical protein [Rugosimonospora africana]|uniref:Uncharacterized protein n=1 Tax=Rugosimonospora africana TaxID=556532 RepID=A0A8J3VNI3_9ACTN|nr:hypothetical protein [Rugosimonospora africana]GIH12253.1 hypothetical protein Raf01_04250 [Rugosimonospora africana]
MHVRGLRTGALRLIAVAAVALGVALLVSLSHARTVAVSSDDTVPAAIVGDDGSSTNAGFLGAAPVFSPLEGVWG